MLHEKIFDIIICDPKFLAQHDHCIGDKREDDKGLLSGDDYLI